ncbi:MAG: CHASE2 domain-containing protein [Spirochaetales bacterium]|nr:CHASE2 domain-containing protein [Spirochaetales bacterium]
MDLDKLKTTIFSTKFFGLIIGFIVFILFIWLTFGIGLISNIERNVLDFNFKSRLDVILNRYGNKQDKVGVTRYYPNPRVSQDIFIVGIDNVSLDRYGNWPFPRSIEANLVNTFTRIKDQSQRENSLFLDINITERELKNPINDAYLIEAIKRNNRVYLESFFHEIVSSKDINERNIIRQKILFDKHGVFDHQQIQGDWNRIKTYYSVEAPLKPYAEVSAGYGNVAFDPDRDEVFRRQALISRLSVLEKEIPLEDLLNEPALVETNFERYAWMDKNQVIHDIKYPISDKEYETLKRTMAINAPLKEQDNDQNGTIDERYYIIRKYKDYVIPAITLSLVLNYYHKDLKDIDIVLGKYIRIPEPQVYKPYKDKWTPLLKKAAQYNFPKAFSKADYDSILRSFSAKWQADNFMSAYKRNILFDKYVLQENISNDSLQMLVESLLSINYDQIQLLEDEILQTELLIPIDDQGRMLINFMGRPSSTATDGVQSFLIRPFHYYVADPGTDPEGWRQSQSVENKIVIVGMFATGLADEKPTPYGLMFGPEVNANSINTILMQKFLYNVPVWVNIFILLALVFIASLITSRLPTLFSLIISLLMIGIFFLTVTFIFDGMNLMIIFSGPALAVITTFVSIVAYRVMTEEREKKKIKNMFGKYVSPTVVEELMVNPPELGGVDKELTVFFSDIRGFTTLSESMTPQALVNHLNDYLTAMTDIILEYKGTLDKYVGDEIMCFWGAPLPAKDHALLACKCALKQMDVLHELNNRWPVEKRINIGIGINSGIMTVGNMGSMGRMNYTLMGDNVNLGARLEGTNKQYFTNIIISEYTYGLVKDHVIARELDNIRVKGKNKPVVIYELLDMIEGYEV